MCTVPTSREKTKGWVPVVWLVFSPKVVNLIKLLTEYLGGHFCTDLWNQVLTNFNVFNTQSLFLWHEPIVLSFTSVKDNSTIFYSILLNNRLFISKKSPPNMLLLGTTCLLIFEEKFKLSWLEFEKLHFVYTCCDKTLLLLSS